MKHQSVGIENMVSLQTGCRGYLEILVLLEAELVAQVQADQNENCMWESRICQ